MSTIERAIEIAVSAHKAQKDKSGNPYVLHVLQVMLKGKTNDEKILGALHDVVEDTDWTFDMLKKEGFTEEILAALRCVTKLSEDEDYDAFTERVKTNALAIRVKINDLESNMDLTRLEHAKEDDIKRFNKYLKAYRDLIVIKA